MRGKKLNASCSFAVLVLARERCDMLMKRVTVESVVGDDDGDKRIEGKYVETKIGLKIFVSDTNVKISSDSVQRGKKKK